MREITKEMIIAYRLKKLGYDFMGYEFNRPQQLSFHHLIIQHRYCKENEIGEGYLWWNGAILVQKTSHDYLHIVENYDYDRFLAITSELIDENIKGYLDQENLLAIDDILTSFEKEYCGAKNKKGYPLIKEEYTQRLIRKRR